MAKHVHADNIVLYGQDAQETETPWDRWQININGKWQDLGECFYFMPEHQYRRKPRMMSVKLASGEVVSWPEPQRTALEYGDAYFYVDVDGSAMVEEWECLEWDRRALSDGWVHLTEEAAQQHASALRKINTQGM